MNISKHLRQLERGQVAEWNKWWTPLANAEETIGRGSGLDGVELSGVDLTGVDLRRWNLLGAKFLITSARKTRLAHARLSNCDLTGAMFDEVDLHGASLRKSDVSNATFQRCNLRHANLTGATVKGARFIDCSAYGAGLWKTKGKPTSVTLCLSAKRDDCKPDRTGASQEFVVAHDLDSAAFLYLLADNPRISAAFDHLNRQVVLILGSFKGTGLARLHGMKLRLHGHYVPIVFDFSKQERRSLTETVGALAHMSCFVIVDLTSVSSVPQELSHIVPFLPSVPVVPLLPATGKAYSMFEHWLRYPWVVDPVTYGVNFDEFLKTRFQNEVIEQAARLRDKVARRMLMV